MSTVGSTATPVSNLPLRNVPISVIVTIPEFTAALKCNFFFSHVGNDAECAFIPDRYEKIRSNLSDVIGFISDNFGQRCEVAIKKKVMAALVTSFTVPINFSSHIQLIPLIVRVACKGI